MLAIPNVISFGFLIAAVFFARKKQIRAHKAMVFLCMMTSFVLVYLFAEMRLQGASLIDKQRLASFSVYFKFFLASHILAATLTFLVSLIVCVLGFKEVKKKWHKKIAYILVPLWAYSSVSGVLVYFMVGSPNTDIIDPNVFFKFEKPIYVENLKFQSTLNSSFSEENLANKWTFLYIGYTQCPDICPLTLSEINKMNHNFLKSNESKNQLQFVFLTADPKRDSLEDLKSYVTHFDQDFIALRSDSGLETVFAEKLGSKIVLETPDSTDISKYSVFHPTGLYLFGPNKTALGYFVFPLQPKSALAIFNDLKSKFEGGLL